MRDERGKSLLSFLQIVILGKSIIQWWGGWIRVRGWWSQGQGVSCQADAWEALKQWLWNGKEVDTREIPGEKQSRETDSMWDINSERYRKRNTFGRNEFQLYCFWGAGDGLDGGFFPGGSDGKESACTQETWVLSLGQEDALEKGMATHSSILAWRIPTDRGASGLQSMGSQRVDWTTTLLLSRKSKCPNDQEDAFTESES